MAGEFLHTLGDISQLPGMINGKFLKGHGQARVAMVGRSNVGKSSLINALVGTRVAQVSNQPGKTRAIHFYLWKETNRIVADLPGYGYARAGHDERRRWEKFIHGYLTGDPNLEKAIVLLDARHGPTEIDCQAIRFLSLSGIPVNFVFAKADTLKTQSERASRRKEANQALLELYEQLEQETGEAPSFDPKQSLWVSSKTKDGLKQLAQEFTKEVLGD